jgi:transposase
VKSVLEKKLSKRTNELFDLSDKIILYDLTNTYFEGSKRASKLAQYGRSKEKRSDAKLVVLAMVVNAEGFLKYSSIYPGNTADSVTLTDIIDNLRLQTSKSTSKATVVIDAGIATDENLALLEQRGYDYVCVSRSDLKHYHAVTGSSPQIIATKNKQELSVQKVESEKSADYYLKVKSPGKTLKESSMKEQFEARFETELTKLKEGLTKKHTTKKASRIHQRIGRYTQKYPSVSKYYDIEVITDDHRLATAINWSKNREKYQNVKDKLGVYFIRTNLPIAKEATLWKIYNTIREIESSFRTLKTDLDLRPIYHKKDNATEAHLHLGLLAYWLVNTVRFQLKQKGITDDWQEIVRIANTQKMVTTTGTNLEDQCISVRKCSEPNEALKSLYKALGFKPYPIIKRKSVVQKPEIKKKPTDLQILTPN